MKILSKYTTNKLYSLLYVNQMQQKLKGPFMQCQALQITPIVGLQLMWTNRMQSYSLSLVQSYSHESE